jgi:hypothetical protein
MKKFIKTGLMIFLLLLTGMEIFSEENLVAASLFDETLQVLLYLKNVSKYKQIGDIIYHNSSAPEVEVYYSYYWDKKVVIKPGYASVTVYNNHTGEKLNRYILENKSAGFSFSIPNDARVKVSAYATKQNILTQESPGLYNATHYFLSDLYSPDIAIAVNGNPAPGSSIVFYNDVTLSANATDAGSGVDGTTWQYSVNGGADINGKQVTLKNSGVYNVSFRVLDQVGNKGLKNYKVTIDRTAPVITINKIPGAEWTNGSSVTLEAAAADDLSGVNAASWQYSYNNAAYNNADASSNRLTVSTEGITQVWFKVNDFAGNSSVKSVTVNIDRTLPFITVTGDMGSSWTKNAQCTLNAGASDALSGLQLLEYDIDKKNQWINPGSSQAGVTIAGEGKHQVEFRARDRAGNITSVTGRVNIDTSPPVIDLSALKNIQWINRASSVSGIKILDAKKGQAENSGAAQDTIQYSVSGQKAVKAGDGYNSGTGIIGAFKIEGMAEGDNTVVVSAADNAGNNASEQIKLKYDSISPSFNAKIDGYIHREGGKWVVPVRVFDIADSGSGFDYATPRYALDQDPSLVPTGPVEAQGTSMPLNGQRSGNDYIASLVYDSLGGGPHTLTVRGFDIAGNDRDLTINIEVDDIAPVFSCDPFLADEIASAGWYNRDYFEFDLRDDRTGVDTFAFTIKLLQANGYWAPASAFTYTEDKLFFNPEMIDGIYQITVNAKDRANNQMERTVYLKLDRTPPEIKERVIKSPSKIVTVTGSDNISGVDHDSWHSSITGSKDSGGYTVTLEEGRHEVEFTVKDAAGNSASRSVTIIVDLSPPELTISAPGFAAGLTLPLSIDARDALTDITEQWYWLDNKKILLNKTHWQHVVVSLEGLEDGVHYIKAGASDETGNAGESAVINFVIDRTPPEILDTVFRDTGDLDRVIGERDYISEHEIQISVSAEDQYSQGNDRHPGNIKAFYWDIAGKPSASPVFNSQRSSVDAEFIIMNLNEGANYISLIAEDEAGNRSPVITRKVLRDPDVPGAAVIRSTTHGEARRPEQASPLARGEFQFFPGNTVKSGIAGYQWKLEKIVTINGYENSPVLIREGAVTELDQEGKGRLFLEPGDNEENEFYRLIIRCIGGNRKAGAEGVYQFRVDTTPPNEIRIRAVPQADETGWYNGESAYVSWNKPADMTGVAEYRYMISGDENWKIPGDVELQTLDLSSWSTTRDAEFLINVRGFLGVAEHGTIKIAICAIDYIGNRRIATASFANDFITPAFKNANLVIADQDDHMGRGKLISWGEIQDDESGVDRVTLIIKSGESPRSYILVPGTTEYLVSPLEDDSVFTVTVRAYDRAGNKNELYGTFSTGNAVLPPSYAVPYFENINGYELSGDKIISAGPVDYENIKFRIPESMSLFEIQLLDGHESR